MHTIYNIVHSTSIPYYLIQYSHFQCVTYVTCQKEGKSEDGFD